MERKTKTKRKEGGWDPKCVNRSSESAEKLQDANETQQNLKASDWFQHPYCATLYVKDKPEDLRPDFLKGQRKHDSTEQSIIVVTSNIRWVL